MDYTEEQRLRTDLKQAKEDAFTARQLMESMSRLHAAQDQKIVILTSRLERIEKILRIELEQADKEEVTGSRIEAPKKGIVDRILGR